jgi:hypothetical protein
MNSVLIFVGRTKVAKPSGQAIVAALAVFALGLLLLIFSRGFNWTLGFWLGVLALSCLAATSALSAHYYSPILRTAWRTVHEWHLFGPISAVLCLGVFSITLEAPGSVINALKSAGTVFTVGAATVTIVAFLFAISRLDDIHGRILDYAHLLERMRQAIEIEIEDVRKDQAGHLTVFGNFPAVGSISAPVQYRSFYTALNTLLVKEGIQVKVAFLDWRKDTLDDSPMGRFIETRFGNATSEERAAKVKDSLTFLKFLANLPTSTTPNVYAFKPEVTEAPFQVLITSTRMILAVTMNYPSPNAAASAKSDRNTVHVIGVETSDQTVIREMVKNIDARLEAMATNVPLNEMRIDR